MNINYEYYRIFYYAAKYGNLTQAAEVLHGSQPNLSRAIRLLEEELGCVLFVRSNRGMSLTPEGERLYSRVRAAVEQIQSAENEIQNAVKMQEGCITIGVSETALRMLVLPVLGVFKKKYPGVHIRILNNLTAQAIESAGKGLVDFAVAATLRNAVSPLMFSPLVSFRDILIGGPSCAAGERTLTLQELASYPLVCLGKETMTYQFYEEFYRSHGLEMRPELEAATTDQLFLMIEHDLGVGYIPEIFAREAIGEGRVRRLALAEEIPSRQICLVENRQRPLSIAAQELKALLAEYGAAAK